MNPVLQSAALDHAAHGWPVFPCNPETKRPLTAHGFKDASTDPKVIEAWWSKWPAAMIGVPTGEAIGAWVLDVDDPAAFEASCDIVLPATRRSTTGKGYHLFYRWDADAPIINAQRTAKSWGIPGLPGADVRGQGGYVIVPPSLHPSGKPYTWACDEDPSDAPDELVDLIRNRRPADAPVAERPAVSEEKPRSALRTALQDTDSHYGMAALKRECELIAVAGAGAQEGTLNAAALKIGALVGGGELSLRTASSELIAAGLCMTSFDPRYPWTPEEVAAKVARGIEAGQRSPRSAPPAVATARRLAAANDDAEMSEDTIALAFTAQHGGSMLFDNHAGRWFRWDGVRWEMDETDLAFDYARQLARELGEGKRAMGRAATAGGVEKLARADRAHAVTSAVWDRDPYQLGTPSGSIDLRTGILTEPDRDLRITKLTGAAPAHGEPTVWLRFLRDSLGGDEEMVTFLQLWCGYSLTGLTSAHALLFIYGPGGNGKSVFLNTVTGIMGDYAVTAAMETFADSRNDRHSTELAMLRGARLVTASETEEGKAWAEARIKALTGGDPITARFMRQDNFTFRPQFKLTIAGNHAPALRNVDDAMRRRFNIAPFVLKPTNPDRELEEKLKAEWPQILAWMIAGARKYLAGGLTRPEAIARATDEYFAEQDVFGRWLAERCNLRAGAFEALRSCTEIGRHMLKLMVKRRVRRSRSARRCGSATSSPSRHARLVARNKPTSRSSLFPFHSQAGGRTEPMRAQSVRRVSLTAASRHSRARVRVGIERLKDLHALQGWRPRASEGRYVQPAPR